ncbi:TolC family protein [Pedobacter namyangjuensis]|uniref:TolC family protein n=1 Tax=Pedobacter namyangjuensis TaxID=600626 RepID=UPI000DE57387|nr:TolC family protein [Pedobacter namyangjuensis]
MKHIAKLSFFKKLSYILTFTVALGMGQKSFAQEVITIQQAVENTLKNNLQVKQAQFSAAISDENLVQSKNALLPTFNGNANVNKNFGRSIDPSTNTYISQQFTGASGSISAGADLFQGFQKINQIKQNRLLLDADKTNVEKIKNDLILQVVTSYMQILFNRDLLKASTQQLEVAKQTLNREQALLDAGNKTLADVSQAKSQVAISELDVTNAQNNLAISYLTLNQLMEMPSEYRFEVQAPLITESAASKNNYNITEIFNNALNTFPDVKLAALRTAAAEKAVDIAKGAYSPRLSLSGGLGSNYSSGRQELVSTTPNGTREIGRTAIGNESVVVPNFSTIYANQRFTDQIQDNFNQSIGLNLSIPIFNGFAVRSNVRRAKLTYQNTQVQEQLTKNNLSKVISQAVVDVRAAESRFQSTTNAFNAQKDAFYVVEQRYNVGLVNSLDFSTAQTNKNKAEIDMIQAKYDLLFRAKVIDYYLGKQITF